MENLYGIYRVDHDTSRTHSWYVIVQRRHHIHRRHFSDQQHGGKRKALEAAKTYRETLLARLRPLSRREVCVIRKKTNRSGVSGVVRIEALERDRGRIRHRVYWDVQWPVGNGKARHKKFSVKKYGERGAYLRALRARQQALLALGNAPRPYAAESAPTGASLVPAPRATEC